MFCKHCGAKLDDDLTICPDCGADLGEKAIALSKGAKKVLAIIGCVLLVIMLAAIVFVGAGGKLEEIPQYIASWFTPKANNIYYKDSYTIADDKADKYAGVVVATVGEHKLTNAQLQVFYWMQVYDFIEQTGGYTSYYGLDLSKPLEQQEYSTTGKTWQQAFLENALSLWTKYVTMKDAAAKDGFTLPQAYQDKLSNLEQSVSADATKDGFESADAMLQEDMGKGVSLADYKYYLELYYTCELYWAYLTEKDEVSMEQIENWYAENIDSMTYYGIDKECGNMSDVRHLLVSISKVAGEDKTTYSEADWESCRQQAQALLDQWLAGEKTEESLTAMIKEHSHDTYAKTDGGLFEYVYKSGQYVEAFEDWCADTTRAAGDYGLIKTSYGYHVMYCVKTETAWIRASRDSILSDRAQEIWDSFDETASVEYSKIAIAQVNMKTA